MLVLLVLWSVVGYVASQGVEGCCSPDRWEGYAGELTTMASFFTRGKFMRHGMSFSYDYPNKKVAETVFTNRGNKMVATSYIFDFNNQRAYRFHKERQYCRSFSFKRPFKRFCIRDGSLSPGDCYIGINPNLILTRTFLLYDPKVRYNITTMVTWDDPSCIPITDLVIGKRRSARFVTTVGFADITAGIRDPSVFTPPHYCGSEFKNFEEEIDEALDSFLVEYIHSKYME